MQLAQRRACARAEIGAVAERACAMCSGTPSIQLRTSTRRPANSRRGATPSLPTIASARSLACEKDCAQAARSTTAPRRCAGAAPRRPRRPARDSAALDGREHVALEHDVPSASARRVRSALRRVRRTRRCPHSSCCRRAARPWLFGGSRTIAGDPAVEIGERAAAKRLRSCHRLGGRAAVPVRPARRHAASGGNRPKLMFIGWNERGPASIVSM